MSAIDESSASDDLSYMDENNASIPSKPVTFTPTRAKPRPRAWERKPSTPFAPRTGAQKIWKRVPLQDLASTVNTIRRKDGVPGSGIMRPVKRLRVESVTGPDDKENFHSIPVKWEAVASPDRSPRRKAAATYHNHVQPPRSPTPADETSIKQAPIAHPRLSAAGSLELDQEGSKYLFFGESSQIFVDAGGTMEPKDVVETQLSLEAGDDTQTTTEQLLGEVDVFLRISPESSPTRFVPASMSFSISPIRSDPASAMAAMSPQPSLAKSPQLSQLPLAAPESELEIYFEPGLESQASTQTEAIPTVAHNDPDDTSYLQDFLLRSRASKAAKLQTELPAADHDLTAAPTRFLEEPEPSFLLTTFQIETPTSPPPATTDEDEDEIESKASSPCRRSSRLTRLPRLQKPSTSLPNSIALRRLNGTEFISMQREAQSLAVATRGNTRKNKGSALAVHARLEQLKSETPSDSEEQHESKKSKTVVWAEILARYQEYTGSPLSSSPESGAEEETVRPVEEGQEVTAECDKKGSKGVRKRRKESIGSVNGTPAPKRSIEILLEDASRTTGQSITLNSQHAAKRTRSGARR